MGGIGLGELGGGPWVWSGGWVGPVLSRRGRVRGLVRRIPGAQNLAAVADAEGVSTREVGGHDARRDPRRGS